MQNENKNKNSLPEITIIPAHAAADAVRFTPRQELTQLPFWSKLTPAKQEQLKEEIKQFAAAKMMHASSGLAMGKYLESIKGKCAPYSGAFRNLLKSFNFAEKTAYRYIETYNNVRAAFPENVLKAATASGLNIISYSKEEPFGKYTEAVRKLPPPNSATPTEAKHYITQLERTYKDIKKARAGDTVREVTIASAEDKRKLLRNNFRGIKNALKQLPPRSRRAFLDDLFGMALTAAGISSAVQFSPQAVPEMFDQGPGYPKGRPRNVEDEEVAA